MKMLAIKILIIFMFISGILISDFFRIEWGNFRDISVIHIFTSIVITTIFIIPFVNKHTHKYIVIQKVKDNNGWLLGFLLLLITISGFYLFFIGNRGGNLFDIIAFNTHLYGSLLFAISLLIHINKKVFTSSTITALLFMGIYPMQSYSIEFTKLKTGQKENMYHNRDWTNSTKCKACHSDIFNQWANSNHKNLAEANPYYMVLEGLAGEIEGDNFREWCMGCHNPSGLTTGLKKSGHGMNDNFLKDLIFEKDAKTLIDNFKKHGQTRLEEGVGCVACHRITKADSFGNASYTIELNNRKKYHFENSYSKFGQYLGEKLINANPTIHKQSYSKKIYKKSSYCASCHDESSPVTGKKIVSTFKEWEQSPYNNPKNKKKHKECIDCHMTYLENGKFSPKSGLSTDGGEIKKDIKVHYFSGSNHFLSGLKSKENENQTIQLLKTAAKLDVDFKNNKLYIGVKNIGAGHHLPTGVADFRELWIDITLKDSTGATVFSSGKLKDNGDLKEDARLFRKVFGDKNGIPVGLLFWKYEKLLSDTRIPAGKRRVEVYKISKNLSYPLSIIVKLNFRIYPQWVTNAVKKMYPQLPSPPVVELNKIEKKFTK
jgi:hypothetical protein